MMFQTQCHVLCHSLKKHMKSQLFGEVAARRRLSMHKQAK